MTLAEYLKTHTDTLDDAKTHKKAWLDLIDRDRQLYSPLPETKVIP